jgi:neutral ceramidase
MNWSKKAQVFVLLAAVAFDGQLSDAAEPKPAGWEAGVAKEDITPTESIWLSGFAHRTKPSEGIRQHIYVRALALQDERGKAAAIVTFDLVAIDRGMADAIAERCRNQYGLSRDRLLLNASHTHTAPVVGRVLLTQFDLSAAQAERVRRFTDSTIDKAVEVVGAAIHGLKPATLEYGVGLAGFSVNRRRQAIFGGVPGGPVDQDVPVLSIRDAGGQQLAVVAGYPCHGTVLHDYLISNDWMGFALEDIDRAYPGSMAFFIQGCAGDAFAYPTRSEELARGYGKILASAVGDVLRDKMTPLTGALLSAFDRVDLPFHHPMTRHELQQRLDDRDPAIRLWARQMIQRLDGADRTRSSYPYPILVWQFGRGLTLIALGGEPVADYGLRLKRQYGFDHTWVAGYSNEVMSYVPSKRVLAEGGYEPVYSMFFYGLPGPYSSAVEEIIVGGVRDLVGRVAPSAP